MENLDILEKLGKVAGIAGIAVGALVLIFGGIIQKNIFPNMTKEQGFRIIRMMIMAASALAIIGIAAWIYTDFQKNKSEKKLSLLSKNITGIIVNESGQGIASVKVYAVQKPESADKSDSDGNFVLPLEGTGVSYLDIVFEHPQYQTIRKKVTVNFEDEEEGVSIKTVTMRSSYPPNPEDGNAEAQINPASNPVQTPTTSNGWGNITIVYGGDDYGCGLDLTLNVGGKGIRPTGNTVEMRDVPLGNQQYTITGLINCGEMGSCTARGKESINIVNGATYYIFWQGGENATICDIGLITQEQFNSLYGL